jgi:hypothetical protein
MDYQIRGARERRDGRRKRGIPELRWPGLRWPELRWPELRWPELRWPELRWPELRWPELRRLAQGGPTAAAPRHSISTRSKQTLLAALLGWIPRVLDILVAGYWILDTGYWQILDTGWVTANGG